MDKRTILVADDEKDIRNLIQIYLKNERYNVLTAVDGIEALDVLKSNSVDLIILDIMMPGLDGLQTCMKIREIEDIPIIMLTAKSEDMDIITGLTVGADDYVTKPFNPLELIARVKSQLRRYYGLNATRKSQTDGEIEIGDLTINSLTHEVKVAGKEIRLTPIEFSILELLAENRGIVFNTGKIYESVWKEDSLESDSTVVVHITNIREKIEINPKKPRYIKTIWGVGYKIDK